MVAVVVLELNPPEILRIDVLTLTAVELSEATVIEGSTSNPSEIEKRG